jgi:hypothetical protein
MFTVRKEQLEVFQKVSRQQFQKAMLKYLRESFAEQTSQTSDADLDTLILTGIDRARRYKVILEDDVQRYLDCMVVYGKDFDSDPKLKWARSALRARNVTGTEKMDFIEKRRKEGA